MEHVLHGNSPRSRRLTIQVFELLTGEYLFDPKESRTYRKDEDHVAQMVELLGDFPNHFVRSGMYANEIFNSRGNFPAFESV